MSEFAVWLTVIVFVGSVLRVLYTVLIAPWPPPVGDDALFFHFEANLLAQGHGFISPSYAALGIIRPTAAHPPLYPLVLAAVAKLGGTGQETQRLAGTVFGAGTVIAIGFLGRRLAGERAGLIAAGIAAVYPMLITADGALLSETLYGLLIAVSLIATYRLIDAPTVGRAVSLGVVLGLTALTRGEALLLLLFLLVPVIRRPGGVRAAAVAVLATVVVIAPWTIRNWTVFDRPVLISTDLASAVAGANCPSTYYGSDIGSWDNACVTTRVGPGNEAASFDHAESAGIKYAEHHLSRLPAVIATRFARVWGLRRNLLPGSKLPRIVDRDPTVLEIGFVMYFVLLAVGIYGFILLRRRGKPVWPLASTFVMVTITAVLVYGDVRFREPAEIALVVLAAVGADQLLPRMRPAA